MIIFFTLFACQADSPPSVLPWTDAECSALFGEPGENTGLGAEQCQPEIATIDGHSWVPSAWSASEIKALGSLKLLNPPEVLGVDPYLSPEDYLSVAETVPEGAVCGFTLEGEDYSLQTFDSEEAAAEAAAHITHGGACGACSTLADLAVYAGTPDLATPVRVCGLDFFGDQEGNQQCLEELGFTGACAEIWTYNTVNTRNECLDVCLAALSEPYHNEDGSLNDCIQCDEDISGPVFKAVAGRTRRNSGLATALCRPCETVWRIEHTAL